jgi:RimJ/RimL family protein N-acetyltransferase
VFGRLNCRRLSIAVKASHKSYIAMMERIGFTQEGVLRRKYEDDDAVIMSMLPEEANRWRTNA